MVCWSTGVTSSRWRVPASGARPYPIAMRPDAVTREGYSATAKALECGLQVPKIDGAHQIGSLWDEALGDPEILVRFNVGRVQRAIAVNRGTAQLFIQGQILDRRVLRQDAIHRRRVAGIVSGMVIPNTP